MSATRSCLPVALVPDAEPAGNVAKALTETLRSAQRPVVLWGAGIGLADVHRETAEWLRTSGIPFVSSWAGLTFFDHEHPGFYGQIGVYGNRGANFILQNADTVIVLEAASTTASGRAILGISRPAPPCTWSTSTKRN